MNAIQPLSMSLCLIALTIGTVAAAPETTADKTPANVRHPTAGGWKITTVGKQGNMGQKVEALNQSFMLTFNEKTVSGRMIEGKPFGFPIVTSHYSATKPGGPVSFVTSYKMVSIVPITWHGKLSEDGTKITDGKFSFMLGSGTFTAAKVVAPAK